MKSKYIIIVISIISLIMLNCGVIIPYKMYETELLPDFDSCRLLFA